MKKKSNYKELIHNNKGIVLFDGYCNLCSWSVQFIIARDNKDYFRFASLQSEAGQSFLANFNLSENFDKSVILIENNDIHFKSEAALRITKKLRQLWRVLFLFIIVPRVVRDSIYSFIANNRFKWFGKKDTCFVPKEDFSYKFLS